MRRKHNTSYILLNCGNCTPFIPVPLSIVRPLPSHKAEAPRGLALPPTPTSFLLPSLRLAQRLTEALEVRFINEGMNGSSVF